MTARAKWDVIGNVTYKDFMRILQRELEGEMFSRLDGRTNVITFSRDTGHKRPVATYSFSKREGTIYKKAD